MQTHHKISPLKHLPWALLFWKECSITAQSGIHIARLLPSVCKTLSKSLDLSIRSTMPALEIDGNHQGLYPPNPLHPVSWRSDKDPRKAHPCRWTVTQS